MGPDTNDSQDDQPQAELTGPQLERELNQFDALLQESASRLDRDHDDRDHDDSSGPGVRPRKRSISSVELYRILLRWLAQLCRIDILYCEHHSWPAEGASAGGHGQTIATEFDAPKWPLLVQLYHLICCIKALISVYFQYVYDINQQRLETIGKRSTLASIGSNYSAGPSDNLRLVPMIEQRILETRQVLSLVGAPFVKLGFFSEIVFVYTYLLSFMIFYLGPQYYRSVPIDFRFAKVLLEARSARATCLQLASQEIRRYLVSSHVFSRLQLARQAGQSQASNSSNYNNGIVHHLELCDHSVTRRQLAELITSCNKRTPGGSLLALICNPDRILRQRSPYYLLITLLCLALGLLLMGFVALIMPLAGKLYDADHYRLADYLLLVEFEFVSLMLMLSATFYCSIVCSSCTDQMLDIRAVKRLIDRCALVNRLQYQQLRAAATATATATAKAAAPPPLASSPLSHASGPRGHHGGPVCLGGESWRCEQTLNSNLLFVYLQFRLLVGQLKRELRCYGIVAMVGLVVILILPLVVPLHTPYLNGSMRVIIFLYFPGTWLFLDTILVPICLVHNRTLDLYRSLGYLLAHTIETSSLSYNKRHGDQSTTTTSTSTCTILHLYNTHLVWLLRKELSYPDVFLRKFATTTMGLKFTFQTLIKIHFWLGVLTLSFVCGVTTSRSAAASSSSPFGSVGGGGSGRGEPSPLHNFFSDPFNVYEF